MIKLKPAFKDYIWGGTRLIDDFGMDYDGSRLAEAWLLSCHPDGMSVVTSGDDSGLTLSEYIEKHGRGILGSNCRDLDDFPILVKLIDAHGDLSVQVHPDDEYARKFEGQNGKSEMWYIVDAEDDAYIYYGFSCAVTKDEYYRRVRENTLTEVLNKVPVKREDVFYIPAGTVHAICRGLLVAEIQQSSNVTYRVYDYGRTDAKGNQRELHVDKAADVLRFEPMSETPDYGGHLVKCPYFTADRLTAPSAFYTDNTSFTAILVLNGEGTVKHCGDELVCCKGDCLFVPTGDGRCELFGDLKAIVVRI